MSVKNYEPILERQLADAKVEIENLKGESLDLFSRLQLAESKNKELESEILAATEFVSHQEWQIDEFAEATALQEDQIANLKAELAKHQGSEFHPDWSMLQATQKSLREAGAEVERLESECEYLGKSVSQLTETRLSLEDTVDRLKKDNADLQRQRDGVQYAKDFLEKTIQRKDQEIEKLKAENDDIASGNGWLIECQKKVAEKLRAEIAELKSTRPQSAAEVLAAVRCKAAPHGWSDRTTGGHPIEFAMAAGKRIIGIVAWCGSETATMWTSGGVDTDCDDSQTESWGFNLVPLSAECTAEPLLPSTPTQPPTADPGIPSAVEVLSAVRSAAAPRGWSDITAGGYRVVAAFYNESSNSIVGIVDRGSDKEYGRYAEALWPAETGDSYRGPAYDLVPATELETWGITDPLPPPAPDPDCHPDTTDEPPIEPTVDLGNGLTGFSPQYVNYPDGTQVIKCDHVGIVRPRQ